MGFGKLFKEQNTLTDFSNKQAIQSGQLKYDAARSEADSERQQADMAFKQIEQEKALFHRENEIASGIQQESYAQGGVQPGVGTAGAVADETARLGKFKEDAMDEQANLLFTLMRTKADYVEQGGLADLLSARSGAVANSMQTKINQDETKTSFYRNLFSGAVTSGLGILGRLLVH